MGTAFKKSPYTKRALSAAFRSSLERTGFLFQFRCSSDEYFLPSQAFAELQTLLTYRDLSEVFHYEDLPRRDDSYDSYQLIRNVLAAHALNCSFCLLVDARRPDLIDDWYQVMKCVKLLELRTRLRIATWQELARVTTPQVTRFLASKYGISAPRFGAPLTPHLLAIS
jgi:hypothetical protein